MRSSDGNGLPPGVVTAIVGVALSVSIMLLSVAVVFGFKNSIVEQLTGFHAQITLSAPESPTPGITSGLRYDEYVRSLLASTVDSTASISLVLTQPAVLKTDSAFQGIMLKGMSYEPSDWQFVAENLVSGAVPAASDSSANTIVLSAVTANALGVHPGDRIMAHFIDENSLRSRRLDITGVYDSHFRDYDAATAFTTLDMLQRLIHADSITGTMIEIRGLSAGQTQPTAHRIVETVYSNSSADTDSTMYLNVSTLHDKCAVYLNWLDLLDTNVVVIVILMSCVAGFTLISSLFIIILQRVATIGLLKALGASDTLIRRTFILMAMRLVVYGLLIGNALAMTAILIEDRYHLLPLDPEAYYLNYVPVTVSLPAIIIINVSAILVAALILILPSHIVSKISPAKSMRYD